MATNKAAPCITDTMTGGIYYSGYNKLRRTTMEERY